MPYGIDIDFPKPSIPFLDILGGGGIDRKGGGGFSLDFLSSLLGNNETPKWYNMFPQNQNRGNDVNGLLEGALAGAGVGAAQAGPRNQGMSPDQELLAQLDALINGSMGGYDDNALQAALQEAASGIRQQFAGSIGLLRDQNQGARADTKRGSKEIRQMYKALARDYRQGARQEVKSGKKVSNQLAALGEREATRVEKGTGAINDKIAEIAAGLDAPDVVSATAPGINEQGQQLSNRALSSANADAKMAMSQSGIESSYLRGQGSNTMLEGTNRAADLYAQLSDYLATNRAKIADLVGQRQAALAQSKASITGDFGQAQMEAMQNMIDNKMALAQLRMQMQNSAADRQSKMADIYGGGGEGGSIFDLFSKQSAGPGALLSQLGDPTVNRLYNSFSDNTSMRLGYYDDNGDANNRVPLQGNYAGMMDYIQERLGPRWNSLSAAQRTALVNALLLQLEGGRFNLPDY